IDHHDLLGVAEARPDLAQAGVALLHALHGFHQPDRRPVDVAGSKIEEQSLADGHESQDDDVVAANRRCDLAQIDIEVVIHRTAVYCAPASAATAWLLSPPSCHQV